MSKTVISVRNLGKKYRLGATVSADTLRDHIMEMAGRLFGRGNGEMRHVRKKDFWALKDVSFDVQRGDVLGVIGSNGAGKSTLLKILTGITEPTEGEIRLKGRVASLLEVGTGFHQELTGRENIYMNGAILGMTRAEINTKFDEIVAFAGVDKFLDTPVKRYSSGMRVRLGFAVAAHLEPEILLIDEVLSVGDAAFQKKCLGKMGDVAKEGRTVLFVSHNMLAVQKLCTRCLFLESGLLRASGSVGDIVDDYLGTDVSGVYVNKLDSASPRIVFARVLTPACRTNAPIDIEIEWFLPEDIRDIKIGIGFNTPQGQKIFDSIPEDFGFKTPYGRGTHKAIFRVAGNTLRARNYVISLALWNESISFDHVANAVGLAVEAAPAGRYAHQSTSEALVNVPCRWKELQ